MAELNALMAIRENLMRLGLSETEAPTDPMQHLYTWVAYAEELGFHNATAMTLATVNERLEPSLRNVLLRDVVGEGLVFYTNYESRKGRDLSRQKVAAALLGWLPLERQIRLTGIVEKVDPDVSDRYFSRRARESQISAVISNQSRPVKNRRKLEEKWEQLDAQLDGASPERPPYWGGYLLIPDTVEFWQGRPHRLHDRLVYQRTNRGWDLERLAP